MTWLLGLFRGLWGYVAAAGGVLLAVLAVHRSGKKAGANEVIVKTKEREVENVRTANDVEREVSATKPDAKRSKLRDKWTRD